MKTPNSKFKKTPLAQVMAEAEQSVTELPWFEVFHAGTHVDSNNNEGKFSRADLEQMVTNFQANTVPFLTGHPKADAPAYGFAKDIKLADDDKLYVDGDQVNVEFAKSVLSGGYGKRSIGIKHNKTKGWYIDHIAFLGAVKPALDMQPVGQYTFESPEEQPQAFEFSIETQTANALVRLMRSLRDFFIETQGQEKADKIIDQWDANWLQEAATREEIKGDTHPEFSLATEPEDPMSGITKEQLDEAVKNAAREAADNTKSEFSQQLTDAEQAKKDAEDRANQAETKLAEAEFAAATAYCQQLVDKAIEQGRLTPAQAEGLAEFMASLQPRAADQAQQFEFSRGEGDKAEKVKNTHFEFAKGFIEKLGVKSPLGDEPELANGPTGDPSDLLTKARQYQKSQADAGVEISIEEAISEVGGNQ